MRKALIILMLGVMLLPLSLSAQEAEVSRQDITLTANSVDHTFGVEIPPGWSLAPVMFQNARSLVYQPAEGEAVTVNIHVEPRLDHADALQQIQDFASVVAAADKTFTSIDGWTAVQIKQLAILEAPGHDSQQPRPVMRVLTYIAADDLLVSVVSNVAPDAEGTLVQLIFDIGASLTFAQQGDAAVTAAEIQQLQSAPSSATSMEEILTGPGAADEEALPGAAAAEADVGPGAAAGDSDIGANARLDTAGRGELEIAASPDGKHIVVALQRRRFFTSHDGGATFPDSGQFGSGNGDPSIAYAQSGAFYFAWIDTGCGSTYQSFDVTTLPAQTYGYDCTGFARSDDNGANFLTSAVNPTALCIAQAPRGSGLPNPPGFCFPDQEHIAADRWNPGGGGDQVYSTWRQFDSGATDAGLVCTQDSAVTWTAPISLGANSLFPRVTVGSDGFVYVAAYGGGFHRIWKYTSCANGLTLVPGFPKNVAPRTPYACPFAGHDRCDQNPTSQVVAVDDTDPNHVYYAFTNDNAAAGSDSTIIVKDSLDGGVSWPLFRIVAASPPTNARRIMPWICTTGGDAALTWYEAPDPVPSDRVDHVGALVGLDDSDNLVNKLTFPISEVSDNWCDSGWPCGTRQAPTASESCPIQPQLAGLCQDAMGNNQMDGGGNTVRCDFSNCGGVSMNAGGMCECGAGFTCEGGNGCPKYGDYNGNACAGGKLFAAWPSASAPAGVPGPDTATNTGVLFDVINLPVDLPVITVPGSVHFGETCTSAPGFSTLDVCNTGKLDLQVDVIASNNADFNVTIPSSGFPVTISPDFCFPFEVEFNPTTLGMVTGTLSIPSNDPNRPTVDVSVDGIGTEQNLVTVLDGDFEDVCLGDSKIQTLTILNDGGCDLTVTDVSIDDDDGEFTLATVMSTPFVLRPGESVSVEVEFTPNGDFGGASGTLEIESDDPDTPMKSLNLIGNSPPGDINLAIANSGDFGEVCKGDHADLDLTLFNQGKCDLTITSIDLLPDPDSFELPANLTFPLVLSHDADFTVPVRFSPDMCFDDPSMRTIKITSDDPDEMMVNVDISGNSPCPNLIIDPVGVTDIYSFPPTVVDSTGSLGCYTEKSVTLRNNGACPLTIDSITGMGVSGDPYDYAVVAPTVFPVILPSGEETLEVAVRFTPQADADPLAPSEVTGLLTVVSDDPDGDAAADLCGESVAQSGVRIHVTDISTGTPISVAEVDSITLQSKGIHKPSPINLQFSDQPVSSASICGNTVTYHVDQETLPSTDTTGNNPKSSYKSNAKEGNLQISESFGLGQCELREYQLQLSDSDAGGCLLAPKGAACTTDGECCSGKCKGKSGSKTCK